jgi:predicted nucleic acid-binding protein
MPAAEALLDSNVLVYALSDLPSDRRKRVQARNLIASTDFGLSYQILMESWVVATRKMEPRVPLDKVAAFLKRLLEFPCVAGTEGLYEQALQLSVRFKIHPYDAAIIAAAQELGASTVFSEDLSHGQDYDGVRVINPFLSKDGAPS